VTVRITKLGHACVRFEHAGGTLVVDPGGFSEPDAAVGADAVAVTHEHPDHLDLDRLRAAARARPGLEVHAHPAVAASLGGLADLGARVRAVGHGDVLETAGFDVHVYGERHAVIHPDIPVVANVGFRVVSPRGAVFHPGDALTVPEDPVTTLLVPLHAPWSKAAEVVDYVRAVAPRTAVPVHDGLLGDNGHAIYAKVVGGLVGDGVYTRLRPGEGRDV
jgi:L-ascorbate metabolism protein UlaG (beta-lactamase superfamily)